MVIRELKYFPYSLKLKTPFVNSKFTVQKREGFVIRLIDEEGYTVYGDVAPLPGLSTETYSDCETALQKLYYSFLEKAAKRTEFNLMQELQDIAHIPSLLYGLEQTIISLMIKRKELSELLPEKKTVTVNGVIPIGNEKTTLQNLDNLLAENFKTIKIKIDGRNFYEHLKLINKITDRIDDSVRIRLDANGSLNYEQAEFAVMNLDKTKIELIEQPVNDINEIVMLSDFSPIPIAVDEMIKTATDARNLIERSNVTTIVLKPALLGGIIDTIGLIKSAEKLGKTVIVSSAFESVVGRSALTLLAALTNGSYAHGLNTGVFLEEDLAAEPYPINNGEIEFDYTDYPPKFKGIKL